MLCSLLFSSSFTTFFQFLEHTETPLPLSTRPLPMFSPSEKLFDHHTTLPSLTLFIFQLIVTFSGIPFLYLGYTGPPNLVKPSPDICLLCNSYSVVAYIYMYDYFSKVSPHFRLQNVWEKGNSAFSCQGISIHSSWYSSTWHIASGNIFLIKNEWNE